MRLIKRISVFALLALFGAGLNGCAVGGLKSSIQKGIGPIQFRFPYANYVSYYGYVSPSVKPDGKYKGKDAYYLYIWVPAVIDEVGVSMYSPADKAPGDSDFKHAYFEEGFSKNAEAFFDTYLALEKLDIMDPAQIQAGGKVVSLLQVNDDSSELPPNPSGSSYNSLLRHESEVSNPLKALVRGVYRITFTSFRGQVEGSYIATVGTNVPGVKVAASLEELHKLVNEE